MSTTTALNSTASWSDAAIRHLRDAKSCPVCAAVLVEGYCPTCSSDLRGPAGVALWNASQAAVAALEFRQQALNRVPRMAFPEALAASAAPAATSAEGSVTQAAAVPRASVSKRGRALPQHDASPHHHAAPQSSASLQSVLAIAGAGLFAIAAIVFTFFNPDLTDKTMRSVIVALITAVFLGGAWLLARRSLQFSAEAVGALGLVFVGLDVWALAQLVPASVSPWLPIAGVTLVVSVAMIAASRLAGIRVWLWAPLTALTLVFTMWGEAAGHASAAALGRIGTAFAAAALIPLLPRIGARFTPKAGLDAEPKVPFSGERTTLLIVQLAASASALLALPLVIFSTIDIPGQATPSLLIGALLMALLAVHAVQATRQQLPRFWSYAAGGLGTTALALALYSPVVLSHTTSAWFGAFMPVAFTIGLVLVGTLAPLPSSAHRSQIAAGAVTATLLSAIPAIFFSLFALSQTLRAVAASVRNLADFSREYPTVEVWAFPIGLAAFALGFALFSRTARRWSPLRAQRTLAEVLAVAFATTALSGFAAVTPVLLAVRVGILLVVAAAVSVILLRMPQLAVVRRVAALIAVHVLVIFGALLSWSEVSLAPSLGVGVLAAVCVAAWAMPAESRFVHVGAGYAYALVLVFVALGQLGLQGSAVPAITTSLGLLGAIVATFLPRVGARAWYAILAVSSVPFVIAVVQVVFERGGWTALSTGLMCALALTLLLTRRPGLNVLLRTAAASLLVPTLAVVTVSLGAQVLSVSASPVTLPVIAAIVALTLPATPIIGELLHRNGLSRHGARFARIAIEASSVLTGAIAVLLALVREASGLGTGFLVLLILGLGATANAVITRQRWAWVTAGIAYTGALWCVWAIAGVTLLEPYLLPPALGATAVAVVLTARGMRARALYATALAVAIVPVLVLTVVAQDAATSAASLWRALALLGAAWLLLAASAMTRVRSHMRPALDTASARMRDVRLRRLTPLQLPTLIAAGVAAVAGTTLAIRIGLRHELAMLTSAPSVFMLAFAASAAAAAAMLLAARSIRSLARPSSALATSRWLVAPAALALPLGTWFAIERDWFVIWSMWALMIAMLATMLFVASRRKSADVPVWFLFALSFVTAIVAWSPRDLRVEWFSLPLGLFLLAAGALALRAGSSDTSQATLVSWPAHWQGSWPLLAPGLVVTVLASIVATFTDPLTWRAILLIALALLMILIGAGKKLAAPFVIGMLVLPIENVFVFSVQIGRGIESMPWWITLAVVGAVLLILAVTYERRAGDTGTMAARMRDLS